MPAKPLFSGWMAGWLVGWLAGVRHETWRKARQQEASQHQVFSNLELKRRLKCILYFLFELNMQIFAQNDMMGVNMAQSNWVATENWESKRAIICVKQKLGRVQDVQGKLNLGIYFFNDVLNFKSDRNRN